MFGVWYLRRMLVMILLVHLSLLLHSFLLLFKDGEGNDWL